MNLASVRQDLILAITLFSRLQRALVYIARILGVVNFNSTARIRLQRAV